MVCLPVREIIHSLELMDYLLIQVDKPWYNYYLSLLPLHSWSNKNKKGNHKFAVVSTILCSKFYINTCIWDLNWIAIFFFFYIVFVNMLLYISFESP